MSSTIILHFSLDMALEEKMRKSGSPEELLQEEKKEKVYTIHYLKLPEPEREEGHFTGRIKKYMSLLREKLDG